MSRTVAVGLIGVGHHGRRYLAHLLEGVPGLRVTALCRSDAELGRREAEAVGVAYCPDVETLVDRSDVDAVIVVTPPHLHARQTLAALRAGKHVLLEKPVVLDSGQAREISAAAERTGVVLMAAQTLRYETIYRQLRSYLTRAGRLRHVSIVHHNSAAATGERRELLGVHHGALMAAGVHFFDLLEHVVDLRVAEVLCRTVGPAGTEVGFSAWLTGDDDVAVSVDLRLDCPVRQESVTLAGEAGALLVERHVHRTTLLRDAQRLPMELPPPSPSLPLVLSDFGAAIRGEKPTPIPFSQGARAVAIAEACIRSAHAGAPIAP